MKRIQVFEKQKIVFFFSSEGEKIHFKNDNVLIKDANGNVKFQMPCYSLHLLCIVGNTSITSGLILRAKRFGFTIALFSTGLKLYALINNRSETNTYIRFLQYTKTEVERLNIAKGIVWNKLRNQRTSLQRQRSSNIKIRNAIEDLNSYTDKIDSSHSIAELMGIEGAAAKSYFSAQFNNCAWQKRMPRAKNDYINATLDIGYTILFNYIESIVSLFGFDVYYGNLHQEFYMRKSLICDLVEPFRPLIDYQIRKAISLNQCREEDFVSMGGKLILKRNCSKQYVNFLLKPLVEKKEEIYSTLFEFYKKFSKNIEFEQIIKFEI